MGMTGAAAHMDGGGGCIPIVAAIVALLFAIPLFNEGNSTLGWYFVGVAVIAVGTSIYCNTIGHCS